LRADVYIERSGVYILYGKQREVGPNEIVEATE